MEMRDNEKAYWDQRIISKGLMECLLDGRRIKDQRFWLKCLWKESRSKCRSVSSNSL